MLQWNNEIFMKTMSKRVSVVVTSFSTLFDHVLLIVDLQI